MEAAIPRAQVIIPDQGIHHFAGGIEAPEVDDGLESFVIPCKGEMMNSFLVEVFRKDVIISFEFLRLVVEREESLDFARLEQ